MKELNIISTVVGRKVDSLNVPSKQGASVDLTAYLLKKIWDEAFEVKTDANGNQYLFGKLPLATQYGITMYVDGGTLDLPSIFDGLPIDSVTLYWEETTHEDGTTSKILKAKAAGTLGALGNVGEWADDTPENDRIMVQKAGSESWESMLLSEIASASFENISESGEGNAFTTFVLSEDKKYLTLVKGITFLTSGNEEQAVEGKKDFANLFVNGKQLKYNSTNNCWEIDGNLSVTGTISSAGGGGEGGNVVFITSESEITDQNVLYVM